MTPALLLQLLPPLPNIAVNITKGRFAAVVRTITVDDCMAKEMFLIIIFKNIEIITHKVNR